MESAFLASTESALAHFHVSEKAGLSTSQVEAAREKHGPNGEGFRAFCKASAGVLTAI